MAQDIILKTDRAGRVRTPRERQEQIVAEWKNSGVSAMRFARTIGVKYQTLSSWIRRHGGRGEVAGPDAAPRWLEMAVTPVRFPWSSNSCAPCHDQLQREPQGLPLG